MTLTWRSRVRLRVPTRTTSASISITSPARTGALNCTSEYDANRPSSPSVRMHTSVATSPKQAERVGAVDQVAGVVGVAVRHVAAVHDAQPEPRVGLLRVRGAHAVFLSRPVPELVGGSRAWTR